MALIINQSLASASILDDELTMMSIANQNKIKNKLRVGTLGSKFKTKQQESSSPNRIYGNNTEIKSHHPLKEVLEKIKMRETYQNFAPLHSIHKMKEA